MEIREITKKQIHKIPQAEYDERLKKLRKEYDKPCKGMFEFIDAQGGWLEFSERTFPGQDPMYIKLYHGEICELPMGIVKRLNNTKQKIRKFDGVMLTDRGIPKSFEVKSRVRFTPMDVL